MNSLTIPRLLTDKYNLRILSATFYEPKHAQELSLLLNIPIASCYRKVRELEETGLLKCVDRILTREGRRIKLYRSQINKINIFFEKGQLRIKLDLAYKENMEFVENWETLAAEKRY